ncbi:MAG: 4-(cytidine 5'-diphospho)-2-C-methyl-D-erythritol kinase [Candidatus Dasytiphilus stammeri]
MISNWPSPAKLNLFLYINDQYPDGYHKLQTLFQFINYGDTLNFRLNNSGSINLYPPILSDIPKDNNLIIRAAKLLHKQASKYGFLSKNFGADITIIKRLPIGGGLGGGSSNAATTLIALNYLWKINFSIDELILYGLQLGADVPIFINGHTSFAEGIGNKLTPVKLPKKWYLVLYPGIKISTSLVFRDSNLKRNTPYRSLSELYNQQFTNDCQAVVIKRFPAVAKLLSWIREYAPYSRITGTGSCIFAEFNTKFKAFYLLNNLPEGISGFVARGLNTSPLHSLRKI